MSLRIVNFTSAPRGMWKYMVPETKTWIPNRKAHATDKFIVYEDLLREVKKHYIANQMAAPADLSERIQDQVCRYISGKYCVDEKGRRNTADPEVHFDLQTVIQGTLTLGDWVLHGSPIESDQVVMARSNICASCPMNQGPSGCTGCTGDALKKAIEKIVGKRRLPTDSKLNSCMVCGCALIAKTRIPKDILVRHMSTEQMKRLPNFCWLQPES